MDVSFCVVIRKQLKRWLVLPFWFTLNVCYVKAQNQSITPKETEHIDEQVNQQIEFLSEQMEVDETDLSSLTETLNYYKSHPINLNNASIDELSSLSLLSDIQINNLISHICKNGKLICVYELQSIEGFDLNTIKQLLPYIQVRDHFESGYFTLQEMFKYGKHEFLQRYQRIIEQQTGYIKPDSITKINNPNSFYLGDPSRILTRYRFQYNNYVSWAIAAEKDAGEEFFKGTQKQGFDFYGGHIAINSVKYIKNLVVGDYQATFGQGLTLWQGFAFGKSNSPLSIKRQRSGIKPYQSFDENRFFRGSAATIRFKDFEFTGLLSHKKIDANIIDIDTSDFQNEQTVSSLILGGLHHTNSAIKDKGVISQTVLGANAAYRRRNLQLAITAQNMNISSPLNPTPTLYNQFAFKGKHNFVGGIDYNYIFKNVNIFGETAISVNGGKAFCHGLIIALDPKLTFSAHYRNYSKDFQNFFSNAISESTVSQNEQGMYLGFEAKLSKFLTFSSYLDNFQYRWLKANISSPSLGRDILAQLTYLPTKKIEMYVRYRHRHKYESVSDDKFYDYISPKDQYNIRYNLTAQISSNIKIKSRIEYTGFHKFQNSEEGIIMVQDIIFKKINFPLTLMLRYAVFDTQGYNSRLYAFENDIPYSYSVPLHYYKGQRFYVLVNWDATRKLEISVKISNTIYDNQKIVHEGSLNQINANHQTELKFQVRAKF